ncbi:MAG TPA: glycosyltransferase [Terriglobia bacterium]|nr:glycosyltransferase [Terriglobia bacterium]
MSKILILTTSHGASHRRASEALKKAFLEIQPSLTVEIIDALEHCARWFRAYYDSYLIPLRYWPSLWRRIERRQHQAASTSPGWLYRLGGRPLFRFIKAFDADIVIATEIGVCELAVLYKRRTHGRFFLVGLELMDFNQAWVQPEIDLYPVVHPDLGEELIAAGAPRQKVIACGMPIDPAYARLPDRAEARKRLGVRDDLPLILALFGGAGFGKPRQIVEGLRKVAAPCQVVFITGKNRALETELQHLCSSPSGPSGPSGLPGWRVLGWTEHMHEWMVAADLLISKPGGGTVMEAAACGLPLLVFAPLPGNEERTCRWLEKWQAGIWVRSPAELAPAIKNLLEHLQKRENLRQAMKSISHPGAALDAAQMILHRADSGDHE